MYRILVVDDEKDEREVILFLLKTFNFNLTVISTGDSTEAYALLKSQPVDILFTDIQMPHMNGLELAAKARDIHPDIEIIFFSGHDDFDYAKKALSLHAVNYILKPVNPLEFKESLEKVIEQLECQENPYASYENRLKEKFYKQSLMGASSSAGDPISPETTVEDSKLLSDIEQAILLKNPVNLQDSITHLLEKYQATAISHVYIRYLCTTILQYLTNYLSSNEEDFHKITEKIYTFKNFEEIRGCIKEYLKIVLEQMQQDSLDAKHPIHLVKQYIRTHYMEDLSLSCLADKVYLSPQYLSTMFSQATGTSLNHYIRDVRIKRGKELLLTTNMKIADIGKVIGYSNIPYFCRIFQEECGQSPEKYRLSRGGAESC